MKTNIDLYMKQAQKFKVPTREEERELARRYVAGDTKAGHELVNRHLRFAVKIAHQYRTYGPPFEDLVQEANIGLVRALHKFNPELGHRFCTYAVWWCRARITLYIMQNFSLVRFGSTSYERALFLKGHAVIQKLRQINPDATQDELYELAAEELGQSYEHVKVVAERTNAHDTSLDAPLANGDKAVPTTRLDLMANLDAVSEQSFVDEERRQDVHEIVERAARNPRERFIVEKRLLSDDPMTLEEIGQRFELSRERVRQIEETIMHRVAPKIETKPAPWRSTKDRKSLKDAHRARRRARVT